ncbi:VRR-NUC domain-containing protein [Metapseudomonas lalkuanensis]|uniref:VRR-NUC domain-containing protein n=1 Tax=Metapseudomonas lalkuanensis TaxID=2604832 RepID=UPI001CF5B28D|nr:VRR-NUC domain-containing protein [Pseudomonas lalkuanensis]UCP00086.1 VRR-NUC domain-containing protein [Pseudomonas lalkuanensis]
MVSAVTAKPFAPRRTARRPSIDYEGSEQATLFKWLQLAHPKAARLAYHVPNGGHRVKAVASKLKAQGVKAGVSDIVLPMARGGYFGLYIEFKATPPNDAVVSDSQQAFLMGVELEGYMALVCRGINEAMDVINGYMALPPTKAVRE